MVVRWRRRPVLLVRPPLRSACVVRLLLCLRRSYPFDVFFLVDEDVRGDSVLLLAEPFAVAVSELGQVLLRVEARRARQRVCEFAHRGGWEGGSSEEQAQHSNRGEAARSAPV